MLYLKHVYFSNVEKPKERVPAKFRNYIFAKLYRKYKKYQLYLWYGWKYEMYKLYKYYEGKVKSYT